jgi:flotillin
MKPGAEILMVLLGLASVVAAYWVVMHALYKKVGPDEALIVYGRKQLFGPQVQTDKGQAAGFRIVSGGGTFVWPSWEQSQVLSLRMMTLEIDLKHVYTSQGIPINVKAVAQVKVRGELPQIIKAAEGFLGMSEDHIRDTIQETVAGHLRGIIGTLTLEELYRDQKRFQEKVREEAHVDLDGMGFEFRSFVFQAIQDDQGYLNSLGQPKIQEALKNARVATALADREAKIGEETARMEKEQKRLQVDAEIAASEKALNLKKADIRKEVDVANAQATKAGEMELKVQDITIAAKEVERQKLELNATIREKADASKYQTERAADAEQYKVEREAAAERKRREELAQAAKTEGLTRAEAESAMKRQVGVAEGDAIRARGLAEAESRRLLAEALKLYNEAGLSLEALKVLPEIAAAIAEPLSRAGTTTIISNGSADGSGTGAAKLSEDVVRVLSQVAPLMKQLSGVDLNRMLQDASRLPAVISTALTRPEAASARPEASSARPEAPPSTGA